MTSNKIYLALHCLPNGMLFKTVVAIVLCLAMVPLESCSSPTFVSTATLAPLLLAVADLRSNLDGVSNTVNGATADRIHQLSVEADQRFKQLDQIIKGGGDRIDLSEQKIVADIADLTSRVSEEVDQKGFIAFVGVNSTLVNVARVLNGIPFVHTQPYVFAVSPYRILPDATDRVIYFYGFFPDADSEHPLKVRLAGKTYDISEYAGNRVGFEVPKDVLKEATFVEMTLRVPVKRLGIFRGTHDVHSRLYVETLKPFTFAISSYKENPELWATIDAPQEFFANADSSRTSVVQTLSAKDLFSTLVNNNQTYDMESASFAAMNQRGSDSGPPCHCGCDSPYHRLDRWDAGSVTFSLSAPSCGAHMCGLFDSCGGGGTHAEIWLRPTFKVKRRNVQETVAATSANVALGRKAVSQDISPDPQWSVVQIVGTFVDGDERQQTIRTVSKGVPLASADLWTAKVENSVLHIETH